MTEALKCWKCGVELGGLLLPLSRREECPACGADLHTCRFCSHYAPARAGGCDEERAEEVFDKERANFCDFLEPDPGAHRPAGNAGAAQVRAQLAELFGEAPPEAGGEALSDAERAQAELERLFGGGSDRE